MYITKLIQGMISDLEGSYGTELPCDRNYIQGDNTDIIISPMKLSFETSFIT
jgi:hypothetical protein